MNQLAWRRPLYLAISLGVAGLSPEGHSQQFTQAMNAAKQAIRCSIVFSMSADLTTSRKDADARNAIAVLMRRFAVEKAGRQQALAWLDEMELDFRSNSDLAFLREDTEQCKVLMNEQSAWFEAHWESAN